MLLEWPRMSVLDGYCYLRRCMSTVLPWSVATNPGRFPATFFRATWISACLYSVSHSYRCCGLRRWSGARVEWAVTRLTDKLRRRAARWRHGHLLHVSATWGMIDELAGGAPCTVINVCRAGVRAPHLLRHLRQLHDFGGWSAYSFSSHTTDTRQRWLKSEAR